MSLRFNFRCVIVAATSVLLLALVGCDMCRSQCKEADGCSEKPIEDFANYDAALEEWRSAAQVDPDPSCATATSRVAGECAGGERLFLYEETSDWHATLVRYYDAESRAFQGMTRPTMYTLIPCPHLYWPERLDCNDAVVIEVVCGTGHNAGDAINLPGTQ